MNCWWFYTAKHGEHLRFFFDFFSAKNGEHLRFFLLKSSVGGGDPLVTLGIGQMG